MNSLGNHASGIVCLLLDPRIPGAAKTARQAFGSHGTRYLKVMRRGVPRGLVAMVGRLQREPARILACSLDEMPAAIDAALEMARHLGDNSLWVVRLPPEYQDAAVALLTERTETMGRMQ